jgi:hypothetical protein
VQLESQDSYDGELWPPEHSGSAHADNWLAGLIGPVRGSVTFRRGDRERTYEGSADTRVYVYEDDDGRAAEWRVVISLSGQAESGRVETSLALEFADENRLGQFLDRIRLEADPEHLAHIDEELARRSPQEAQKWRCPECTKEFRDGEDIAYLDPDTHEETTDLRRSIEVHVDCLPAYEARESEMWRHIGLPIPNQTDYPVSD